MADIEKDAAKPNDVDLESLQKEVQVYKSLAQQGKLHEAVEGLLNLEKSSRLAESVTATKECCSAILDVCFQAQAWELLQEQIVLLSKRRSQLKQAIQAFVRQAMTYIDVIPDPDTKSSLIKTLQTVTEGKIFVEIERARLTRRLAEMKEAEGNVNEAADILQEVAVETFGAMAKTEKIAFILEQVRLCLDKKDFVKAQILAKKISPRAFVLKKGEGKGEIGIEGTAIEAPDKGIPELPQLKLMYYELMIRYYAQHNNYLELCRCYKAIYESEGVKNVPDQWVPVLKKICCYIILSPAYSTAEGSSSDQLTLLTSTLQDTNLSEVPQYKELLQTFSNSEIILWKKFQQQHAAELATQTEVFGGESGSKRFEDLKLRVTEHNIAAVTKFYSRIKTDRLAALLDLSPDETEKQLSDMVVAKAVAAKVDRLAGVVIIGKKQEPEEILNGWSSNISKLLSLVEKTCQQIQKEVMVHKVVLATSQ